MCELSPTPLPGTRLVRAGQGPLFMRGGRLLDGPECRGQALFALEPLRDREFELELRRRLTFPPSIVPRQPFVLSWSSSTYALKRCRSPRTARLTNRIPRLALSIRFDGWTSSVRSTRVRLSESA